MPGSRRIINSIILIIERLVVALLLLIATYDAFNLIHYIHLTGKLAI